MSGVAAGVTWAVSSVCVVPSAVVASWAAWLQHGSGLVFCGIVLLVVWSAAGFTPEASWLAPRSGLALCGSVLLCDGSPGVLPSPELLPLLTPWFAAVSGAGGTSSAASGPGLVSAVPAEGLLLP